MGQIQKTPEHRLGQGPSLYLARETHLRQKILWHGPWHLTTSAEISQQMVHYSSSAIFLSLMQAFPLNINQQISKNNHHRSLKDINANLRVTLHQGMKTQKMLDSSCSIGWEKVDYLLYCCLKIDIISLLAHMIHARRLNQAQARATLHHAIEEEKDNAELQYIQSLQLHLQHILQTAQSEQSSHLQNVQQLVDAIQEGEDFQAKYEEAVQKCESLQAENTQLRNNWNGLTSTIKQMERKEAFLNKKIAELTHTITEKDAIIKYLEQKQEAKTRRSQKHSSQQSESSLADSSTNIFIPTLRLDNLSLPKANKEPTFHDFMPATTRSSTSDCLNAENVVPSLDLNRDKPSAVASYENYQSQPRKANPTSQRQWNDRKSITNNSSLIKNYAKDYSYDYAYQAGPRQPDHRFVSTYSSTYFNRYSMAAKRPSIVI